MITLYVLCGIPASGKTTLAKELAEQTGAKVHSLDDVASYWGEPDPDGKLHKQWIANIKADLQNGNSVVCDSTALTSIGRRWILDQFSDINCKKVLTVKAVPVEVCLERNENRVPKVTEKHIRKAASVLEAPTKDEGWDAIYLSRE